MTDEWVMCPVCQNKTQLKIREDTILENFPLFCPKCKQETIITVRSLATTSYPLISLVITLSSWSVSTRIFSLWNINLVKRSFSSISALKPSASYRLTCI
ncbi:cysteine-rich KTR domain-containing protein [Alkaliphilus flagellatus]